MRINGALYLWRRDYIAAGAPGWPSENHLILDFPEERAFSIDSLAEFDVADLLLRHGAIKVPWLEIGS